MISDVNTIRFLKTNIVTMISEFESTLYSFWSQYCLVVEKICLEIGGYVNIRILERKNVLISCLFNVQLLHLQIFSSGFIIAQFNIIM